MQCVHSVLGMPTPLSLHAMRSKPLSDGCSGLASSPCPMLGKLVAQARILGWIHQRLDLRGSETRTNVRVLRQQLTKRPSLCHTALGCFVHRVMRSLAPDLLAQLEHEGFSHDQPTREVEIAPHTLREHLQA